MEKTVRVRFAPSPTGPLHIGGVRTALFNYLFARHHGGSFLLRIEDTDRSRYVAGAEEYIIESLRWCGLLPDEGPWTEGGHAPYRQSERGTVYREHVERLLAEGKAYYAFDTPEELEALRQEYAGRGETFSYDHRVREKLKNSLALPVAEAERLLRKGVPHVIRFRIDPGEQLHIRDEIRGDLTFDTSVLDDKVLVKTDGMPTYHLANIVDDHLMEITHVIRGEEWLPSLPLHVLLYRAFGWETPVFAHLPLILKPEGKGKLSKRDGDRLGFPVFPLDWKTAEGEVYPGYREEGYFPEAFVNMLALLGWNPGTEQELFSLEEMAKLFSLERINKSGARFDPQKARWFNHQYLQQKPLEEITDLFMADLTARGIATDPAYVAKVVALTRERVDFVKELWEEASFFFQAPESYDEKVVKKRWKGDVPQLTGEVKEVIAATEPFESAVVEERVKAWIEEKEAGMGKVLNALRLLLVGASRGPHLFDIMEMIGREETVERIERGIRILNKD